MKDDDEYWDEIARREGDAVFTVVGVAAVIMLIVLMFVLPPNAQAATECSEWATMTQVLIVRWQEDPQFKGKTDNDVKAQLRKDMKGHPELEKAMKYVDLAWKYREQDSRAIWAFTYDKCRGEGWSI